MYFIKSVIVTNFKWISRKSFKEKAITSRMQMNVLFPPLLHIECWFTEINRVNMMGIWHLWFIQVYSESVVMMWSSYLILFHLNSHHFTDRTLLYISSLSQKNKHVLLYLVFFHLFKIEWQSIHSWMTREGIGKWYKCVAIDTMLWTASRRLVSYSLHSDKKTFEVHCLRRRAPPPVKRGHSGDLPFLWT